MNDSRVRSLRDTGVFPRQRAVRVLVYDNDHVIEFRADLKPPAPVNARAIARVELTDVLHQAVQAIGTHEDFLSTRPS